MRIFRKKNLAALLLVLLFGMSASAADENITDWLCQTLRDEVASVELYNPTESLSRYGELVYNEKSGSVELTVSAEDVSELTDIARMDSAPRRGDEPEEAGDEPEEELPVVPEGYVLVRVSTANREAVSLCIAEEYAVSPAERAARKAAEQTPEPAEDEPSDEPEAAAAPTPEPVVSATPQAADERSRTGLSARELLFLIAALTVLLIAVAELGIILRVRNRAENVAKNYIHTKAALDKTKRELTAAKSKSVRLERELLEEQNKMAAVKKQFERMSGKSAASAAPKSKAADTKPAPKTNGLPDLDYLDWMS